MNVQQYQGYELIGQQDDTGWRVSIGETGLQTSLHSTLAGAMEEAQRFIDSQPRALPRALRPQSPGKGCW